MVNGKTGNILRGTSRLKAGRHKCTLLAQRGHGSGFVYHVKSVSVMQFDELVHALVDVKLAKFREQETKKNEALMQNIMRVLA